MSFQPSTMVRAAAAVVLLAIAPATVLAYDAPPATDYLETWDSGTRTRGWIKNTAGNAIAASAVQGNPPGALSSTRTTANNKYLGFWSGRIDQLLGDYGTNQWTTSFDLKLATGSYDKVMMHFLYIDGPDDGIRRPTRQWLGWSYSFAGALAAGTGWSSNSVTFDPTWTDSEAIANGWVQDPLRNARDARVAVSWAQTMSSAYKNEVRVEGAVRSIGDQIFLDNYRQVELGGSPGMAMAMAAPVTAVPEPASIALMAGGLGVVGWVAARRRARHAAA